MNTEEWLTAQEVAKMFKVSEHTVINWTNIHNPAKRLKAYRVGQRSIRFKRSDVEDYTERHIMNLENE